MLLQQQFFHVYGHDIGLALPFALVRHIRRDQAELMRTQGLLRYLAGSAAPLDLGAGTVEREQQFRLLVMMLRPTNGLQAGVVNADILPLTEPGPSGGSVGENRQPSRFFYPDRLV